MWNLRCLWHTHEECSVDKWEHPVQHWKWGSGEARNWVIVCDTVMAVEESVRLLRLKQRKQVKENPGQGEYSKGVLHP